MPKQARLYLIRKRSVSLVMNWSVCFQNAILIPECPTKRQKLIWFLLAPNILFPIRESHSDAGRYCDDLTWNSIRFPIGLTKLLHSIYCSFSTWRAWQCWVYSKKLISIQSSQSAFMAACSSSCTGRIQHEEAQEKREQKEVPVEAAP
jgi:hypothetical protein